MQYLIAVAVLIALACLYEWISRVADSVWDDMEDEVGKRQ